MPFVRTHSCFRFHRAVFSIFFFIYYLLHWPQLTRACTTSLHVVSHFSIWPLCDARGLHVTYYTPYGKESRNDGISISMEIVRQLCLIFADDWNATMGKKWLVFLTTCQHGHCKHKRKPFWFWLALNLAYDSDGGTSEQSPLSLWWADRLSASNQCYVTVLQN